MDRVARSPHRKPDTLDLFPSSVREAKIEELDLYTYEYISVYLCPVSAEIFNWTSRPKTGQSGSKPDIWQPYRWVGHVLWHDGHLHEIIEDRMKDKPTREKKNPNYTWFDKWWWLCCTQTGNWGQRGMETQRKDVKNQEVKQKTADDDRLLSKQPLFR